MVNTVAAARAGLHMALGLLPAADRRVYLRTALTVGFLAACGGLLAVIASRGYTIYG